MTTTTTTVRTVLDYWQVVEDASNVDGSAIRLPHDAMLAAGRAPNAAGGSETGWFHGGAYTYRTSWVAPAGEPGMTAILRFEGVQGDAVVSVNGAVVGLVRSGYAEFEFIMPDVLWGQTNDIEVRVDNREQPSERWYPGSGIYRPVSIILRPLAHFGRDGVRLRTEELTGSLAVVEIAAQLTNAPLDAGIVIELADSEGVVAASESPAADVKTTLRVPHPRAWSAEDPHRYRLTVRAYDGDLLLDEHTEMVGLRTVSVDARRGLRINGVETLLRGACIHHDNGPLGAATHRAAEFRRIRLLKEAGFNAVRSAHNPMSRHLLDACDELGMYVLEELADYWFVRKSTFDHSGRFRATWREDAIAMIAKDRNRACVVMYAIGNEIPETAIPEGVDMAREITAFFHDVDPDRPVTVAINLFVNTLVTFGASPYSMSGDSSTPDQSDEPALASSTEANAMVNHIGKMMHMVARLPRADKASRDAFAAVDIAGYNYGLARYRGDVKRYPDRVILGTETLPGDVAWAWRLVKKHRALIGDFVWAGWEYLGEAGVSVWVPGKRAGMSKPYPYVISGPGMFDLTGRPDASLRLAQAAWDRLPTPVITVRPLDRSGIPYVRSAWRITDAVESWSWRGSDGKRANIEVYSTDEEIELILNGRSLGRRRVGRRHDHRVRFRAPYEPGDLVAVAYSDGRETSRSVLSSAESTISVRLRLEAPGLIADGYDLAFVHVELSDAKGNVEMLVEDQIDLSIVGPAELIGFASAAPATTESFLTPSQQTYRGRALAILRSTGGEGAVRITAHSQRSGSASVELIAARPSQHDIPGTTAPVSVPALGEKR